MAFKKALLIAVKPNTWVGSLKKFKYDGDEFCRQADHFAKVHGNSTVVKLDGKKETWKVQTLDALRTYRGFDFLGIFCHGGGTWLTSPSIWPRYEASRLANAVSINCNPSNGVSIALYACSTGSPGGFAETFYGFLSHTMNCQLDAHTTAGHTTENPYVVRWGDTTGNRVCDSFGNRGAWIVSPKDKVLFNKWNFRLKNQDLDMYFPLLSREDIQRRLVD